MNPNVNRNLIIGICLLLVVLIGIFTYDFLDKDKKESETRDLKPNYNISVYRGIDGLICLDDDEECKVSVLNIAVENESATLLDMTNDGSYFLIDDNGLKLYDSKNDKKQNIDLKGYEDYKIGYDESRKEVVGVLCYKEKFINEETQLEDYKIRGFYNILNNRLMYEGTYETLVLLNGDYLYGTLNNIYNEDTNNIETSLLSTSEEKKLNSINGVCEEYSIISTSDSYYIMIKSECNEYSNSTLYTKSLDLIAEDLKDNEWSYDENGYLYVLNDNKVNQYNTDGSIIKTSNEYFHIEQIAKNYIIYVDDGMLKITNEDDVDLDVVSWYYGMSYDSDNSGYKGELNGYTKEESGVYMDVYDNNVNSMYYFNEETQKISIVEGN